jgi:predicted transcriptional regulator
MKSLTLRIPEEIHKKLTEKADGSRRSLNAEIVWRLEVSLDNSTVTPWHVRAMMESGEAKADKNGVVAIEKISDAAAGYRAFAKPSRGKKGGN